MAEGTEAIVIRPLRATVGAYIVVSLFVIGVGVLATAGPLALELSDPTGPFDLSFLFGLPLTIPACFVGFFLAIRGSTAKVTLTATEARVQNLVRTTTIPRALIVQLTTRRSWGVYYSTTYPAIAWRDPKREGTGPRITGIHILGSAAIRTSLQDAVDRKTELLRAWVDASHHLRAARRV